MTHFKEVTQEINYDDDSNHARHTDVAVGTPAGYMKVKVGTYTRYLRLYTGTA